jgi:hypothetical protein
MIAALGGEAAWAESKIGLTMVAGTAGVLAAVTHSL